MDNSLETKSESEAPPADENFHNDTNYSNNEIDKKKITSDSNILFYMIFSLLIFVIAIYLFNLLRKPIKSIDNNIDKK